jgi:hypothetical protein
VCSLLCVTVGCTDSRSATTTEPTQTTLAVIEHNTNPQGIVVQIGDYEGAYGETEVWGPSVVVYGDGTVYLETPRTATEPPTFRTGLMSEASLQVLLRAGEQYRLAPMPTELPSEPIPTLLVIGDHRWSRYLDDGSDPAFDELLALVFSEASPATTATWTPERWIVRGDDGKCTVTNSPAPSSGDDAPVYPHALDRFPLGPLADCF